MRKIIQIAARAEGEKTHASLYALCDDGTLWAKLPGSDWEMVPAVPQGPNPDDSHAAY